MRKHGGIDACICVFVSNVPDGINERRAVCYLEQATTHVDGVANEKLGEVVGHNRFAQENALVLAVDLNECVGRGQHECTISHQPTVEHGGGNRSC